jgi:hypothetical protein
VIDGERVCGVVVVVGVVSVVVGVVSVVVEVSVGAVSVGGDVVSVGVLVVSVLSVDVSVEVLSLVVLRSEMRPNAPDAMSPAANRTPNARTNRARRSAVRPFTSPAPLLPQMRRMEFAPS